MQSQSSIQVLMPGFDALNASHSWAWILRDLANKMEWGYSDKLGYSACLEYFAATLPGPPGLDHGMMLNWATQL